MGGKYRWISDFTLTPLDGDGLWEAGVLHPAGVDVSMFQLSFQHHLDLEGPISISGQIRVEHSGFVFLFPVSEPGDFDG